MDKTFFSINDLIDFCKSKKCYNFSAKTPEDRIKIREIGMFNAESEGEDQVLSVKLKSCHVGRNLNQSFISKDSMLTAMPSFKGQPILGAFVQNEDTKEWDFNGHDMELYEDENGETQVKYIEQIIGNISEIDDPHLEYDNDQDKDFVVVKGKIFKEYTKAEEILKRRKSCACSVELAVQDLSYNTKEDCIELNTFTFLGVTLLGESVKPGMAGSNLVVESFTKNNFNYEEKLVETLDKLNTTLSSFQNTHIQKKGGMTDMDNFENTIVDEDEIKTPEESTDEIIEEATNEETSTSEDAEVVETEACGKKKKKCSEEEDDEDPEDEEDSEIIENNACGGKKKKKCTIDDNGDMTVEFSISHEEIRNGLYNLLMEIEETDNDYYYIRSVYDTNFIYEGWMSGKLYRQSYTKDGDNISLGDRTEVFEIIVTAEERDALEKLKSNYSALVEFKQNIENAELKAQKDAVFADEVYQCLNDNEEFMALKSEADKFSVEEISTKADLIYAAHMKKTSKSHVDFSVKDQSRPMTVGLNFNTNNRKKDAYGGLFNDYKEKYNSK